MADVGVGQQEIVDRIARGRGMADALLQRPQLARPPRRQCGSGKHIEASLRLSMALATAGGAVAAAVVDQHDAERPGIVLAQQAADGLRDHVGLVAGGNDRHDGGPARRDGKHAVIALARQPEAAAREQQVEPHRERKQPDAGPQGHVR